VAASGKLFHALPAGFALAALLAGAAALLCAQTSPFEGRPVVELRIVTEAGRVLAENPSGLALATGKAYSSDAERETLRRLFRTGRYADIRTLVTTLPGGLRVDYVVRENYFIGVVRVVGLTPPPNEDRAVGAMNLPLGEVFTDSGLDEALDRLRLALEGDGLYQAKLTKQLEARSDTREMNVTIQVSSGPRARIGQLDVTNQTRFSVSHLLGEAKLHSGDPVTQRRFERAQDRLRNFLVKKDYLSGRATIHRGQYDPRTNRLPIQLDVSAGPKVRVVVEGARIRGGRLRKLVPVYAEGAVDEDLLQEGRRNIRDYMQRQGYFDAEVNYRLESDPRTGAQRIVYAVEKGPRRRLVGVSFSGNHYFSEDLLRSRMTIRPAGFLSRGLFSPRLLRDDEDSIRQLYLTNGFRQAQVSAETLTNYQGKAGDLFVRFHITEGTQTRVASLAIIGNHALTEGELRAVISSTPGQPYSEANVSSDRDNVLALYFDEGFPRASFTYQAVPAQQADRVALVYQIREGPQVRVDHIIITGYLHTRPGLIRRQVAFEPGQPLRESDVVETQRRLYNLDIFSRVQIAPQNPSGETTDKDILVNVTEAKRYTISYGGGIEVQRLGGATSPVGGVLSVSPRVIFEFSKSNVAGRAQTLAFRLRASTLQYRGLLSYSMPQLLAKPDFSLVLTSFADKTRDVRTFTSSRYEASGQIIQNYSANTRILYRYAFRHVLVDASSLRINPAEIPLFSQPTKISEFGTSWIRDRRNNPADASRGSFNTADLSVALQSIGSSASFLRFFFQNSTYHPLGRSLVFARSARFGVEDPLGNTTDIDIPLPERFFGGGGNSLRGFALNQAGPRDPITGFPIGGLALLVFNQELRFPMRLPFVGTGVGGAIFYDAGNVFGQLSSITLDPSPSSPSNLNFFSHTVGFGLRYQTPIGPVRLDLGYLLNPARFSFCPNGPNGQPDCTTTQTARLPRFQFFFNIGSVF
jgi:outer membrane protein insertion porin family